jgi:hypothetical protein
MRQAKMMGVRLRLISFSVYCTVLYSANKIIHFDAAPAKEKMQCVVSSYLIMQFDGLWGGLGELADKVMNQLGVGGIILQKQRR